MKIVFTLLFVTTSFFMNSQDVKPTVAVSGEGIVKVIPDQATITVRAEHNGKDAKAVKLQNDGTINEVFQFLKKTGIEEKHISSEYINLSKNYDYNTKTYNFVASQTLRIFLTDLSMYEKVMDGLLNTGINRINGVSFSSSKMESLQSEARKKAVLNAKLKAQEYATALGQSIGKAITISEFQNMQVSPTPYLRSMAIDESSSKQTIAPGELDIAVRVNVSFELN